MSTYLLPILQSAASTIEIQQVEAPSPIFGLVALVAIVVCIAALWKVFVKAGEPGWAVLIPIYNIIVLLKISGKPWWWLFLFFIPIVGIVIAVLANVGLAKNFGKGVGFAIGLTLLGPIFFLMLGFGSAQFQGTKG